jgi:cell division protein FtsB
VLVSSIITIVYVNNVVTVNKLLKDNQDKRKELETIRNENAFLKTTLNQLQSPERITQLAQSEFGMTKVETAPLFINDDEK